jgi:uncharacterized membrane protein YcaP (DUF421 family)
MELEESLRFLGIKLINTSDFFELVLRLLLNSLVVYVLTKKIYMKRDGNSAFFFGYNAIALITFLLCFLLSSVKLELGFALGLFAIFAIMRFRTGTIPIKEMTYLFVTIGLAVINALANKKVSYAELFFSNIVVVYGVWLLELFLAKNKREKRQTLSVILGNIEEVVQWDSLTMTQQLEAKVGRKIVDYKIKKLNHPSNNMEVTVYI